jgi:hypothetical protein
MYRIYLRAPDQSVTDKTVTGDPVAALAAFRTLTERTGLDGTAMLAVLNKDGKPVAHHRFDGHDPTKQWRGRTHEIDLTKAG